jgi:hypothetical protein
MPWEIPSDSSGDYRDLDHPDREQEREKGNGDRAPDHYLDEFERKFEHNSPSCRSTFSVC